MAKSSSGQLQSAAGFPAGAQAHLEILQKSRRQCKNGDIKLFLLDLPGFSGNHGWIKKK